MNSGYNLIPTPEKAHVLENSPSPIRAEDPKAPHRHASHWKAVVFQILSHIFTLLWLAPAAYLLYINFTSQVIGDTLWCPSKNCSVLGNGVSSVQQAIHYDRNDHDVIGALLFAQKGFEIWFAAVAGVLVYELIALLGRHKEGIPVGYMLLHLEFGEILNLFNPLVWTSPFSSRGKKTQQAASGHPPRVRKFLLFAAFLTFLTIVNNLMGPAGGALVLPSVQWTDTAHLPQEQFNGLFSANPPSGDSVLVNCTATELATGNYSCTSYAYSPVLDNIASSILASTRENMAQSNNSLLANTLLSESQVQFTFENFTETDPNFVIVPCRQTLRRLSTNILDDDGDFYPQTYNDSIQATAHQSGPAIGAYFGVAYGNFTIFNVSDDKQVRCMDGWEDLSVGSDDPPLYTKCVTVGDGWSPNNNKTSFTIQSDLGNITVNIYFSSQAMYSNDTTDFNSSLSTCLANPKAACDWDHVIAAQAAHLPVNLTRQSTDLLLIENIFGQNTSEGWWQDFTSYTVWADYTVDLSPYDEMVPLVSTTNVTTPIPGQDAPLVVSPAWVLAAWSVNPDGILNETSTMGTLITSIWDDSVDYGDLVIVELLATAQALSLIPYGSTNFTSPGQSPVGDDAIVLSYWRSKRVWMFSLDSRTSKLGAAVVCIGGAIVLMRTFLAIYDKVRHNHVAYKRSPTEIVVATLKHEHQGEFNNLHGETAVAQVRYQVQHDRESLHFRPKQRRASL